VRGVVAKLAKFAPPAAAKIQAKVETAKIDEATPPVGDEAGAMAAAELTKMLRARVHVAHLTRRSIAEQAGVEPGLLDAALAGKVLSDSAAVAKLAAWASAYAAIRGLSHVSRRADTATTKRTG
jgi:hypothetical protein